MTNAEKYEFQDNIKELNTQKDSINNEFRHAVNVIKKLKKKRKESAESEKSEESEKYKEFMRGFYGHLSKKI